MIYSNFKEKKLSRLGLGAMRLPKNEDGSIDVKTTEEMVDYAMAHGLNYFDTAWPYHGGTSEIVLAKALSKYPRESYNLSNKFPGHQIADEYHPDEIFEEQLRKCNVEYFDFYMLHNVYENSIGVYKDERWKILDYFIEQKRNGRIKHLGFSCHGGPDVIEDFLDYGKGELEFCMIQLNYLDYTLQRAKEKIEILNRRNVPIWVMEPFRGGRLESKLTSASREKMQAARPEWSHAAWAFRWVRQVPGVTMILSGMSSLEQLKENVSIFDSTEELSESDVDILMAAAEDMKNSLPCTECRYCVDSCPMGLDIPTLIERYNELRCVPTGSATPSMRMDAFPADKLPSACLGCGACAEMCPQKIDIPGAMSAFAELLEKQPKWAEICKERQAEAEALKNK